MEATVMKTLLIATQKGGVGKSALLCQLAHYLHFIVQWRVLVIDLDDQANSSRSLERAHKATPLSVTASTLFMNDAPDVGSDLPTFAVVKADDVLRRLVEQPEELRKVCITRFRALTFLPLGSYQHENQRAGLSAGF